MSALIHVNRKVFYPTAIFMNPYFSVNATLCTSRLLGPNQHLEVAGLAHIVEVGIIELQGLGGDIETHRLCLALGKVDAPKAAELLNGTRNRAYHVTDVHLYRLVGITAARVGHVDSQRQFAFCIHGLRAETRLAIADRGVAEAVTKREERLVVNVEIV